MALLHRFQELSATYQAGGIVLGLLVFATILVASLQKIKPGAIWTEVGQRIKSWWMMVAVFLAAIALNRTVSIIFFACLSFWALKEYVTILDTRRADHRALFWAFLTIPIQYYWVGIQWYGMFIIFIPVYMFLFLPMRLVMAQAPAGFLSSSSKVQWGLMAFVFGLSHMAYLLVMPHVPGSSANGQSLLFFLVLLTELNDIFQYIWGKTLGKRKILPTISPKKTWEGFLGGLWTTLVIGLVFRFLTPFDAPAAIGMAFVIAVAGFSGDVVMSAVKRDAGVKDFGALIPGHGGMLDRVDSLCYTAPLFFHIVRYFYYP
ncbi:MAG: phosphatidate cytidylyltransferase [Omnitrophica bacterium RIFOXYB12_FULL_50_7]|nr:MAG: phosphatidate cytidylyltransferase [Omnitrophica bacterium RIFOXYB12_FULL_50_7]